MTVAAASRRRSSAPVAWAPPPVPHVGTDGLQLGYSDDDDGDGGSSFHTLTSDDEYGDTGDVGGHSPPAAAGYASLASLADRALVRARHRARIIERQAATAALGGGGGGEEGGSWGAFSAFLTRTHAQHEGRKERAGSR